MGFKEIQIFDEGFEKLVDNNIIKLYSKKYIYTSNLN